MTKPTVYILAIYPRRGSTDEDYNIQQRTEYDHFVQTLYAAVANFANISNPQTSARHSDTYPSIRVDAFSEEHRPLAQTISDREQERIREQVTLMRSADYVIMDLTYLGGDSLKALLTEWRESRKPMLKIKHGEVFHIPRIVNISGINCYFASYTNATDLATLIGLVFGQKLLSFIDATPTRVAIPAMGDDD